MTITTDIGLVITYLNNIWKTHKNKNIRKHMRIIKFWKTHKNSLLYQTFWEYNSCAKIKFEIKSDYTKRLRKVKGMIDTYIAIPKKLLYWPLKGTYSDTHVLYVDYVDLASLYYTIPIGGFSLYIKLLIFHQ